MQINEETVKDTVMDTVDEYLPTDYNLSSDSFFDISLAPLGTNASFSIAYGENELTISSTLNNDNSEALVSIFKFDNFFLYSFDTNG